MIHLADSRFLAAERVQESLSRAANPATVFIGRASELEVLAAAIREAPLITLHGPPGVGKTRLLREYCAITSEAGPVRWCDAAFARTVDALCSALSVTLGVSHPPDSSLDEKVEHVSRCVAAASAGLLVLDNVEQIARDARLLLAAVLDARPTVRIVVTSREPLGLPGEIVIPVDPLPLPDARETDPQRILNTEAVQLLCERARAVRSSFRGNPHDAPVLAEIARSLDGIPLAIELAAAQLDLMGPLELRDRLNDHLRLSRTLPRDTPARQATVEAAIDWSWQLLSAVEQDALVQSSIFVDGFTLDAARSVLDLGDADVAATLRSLRLKSLLFAHDAPEAPGTARLRLYESVRAFASERAHARDAIQARHARYYAQAFEAAAGAGMSVRERARVRADRANLRAACRWASATGALDLARQLALALAPVLLTAGPLDELCSLLDAALADLPDAKGPLVSRALLARGEARRRNGAIQGAIGDLEQAVAQATDPALEVLAICSLARAGLDRGDSDRAWAELTRAEILATRNGFARGSALALVEMGRLEWTRMHTASSRELLERSLAQARAAGDVETEARAMLNLGILSEEKGRGAAFLDNLRRARELFAALGDQRNDAIALLNLGVFETDRGRYGEAREYYRQAAERFLRIGDRTHVGIAEGNLGISMQAEAGVESGGEHLQRACDILAETGPVWAEALIRAALGASLAARAHLEEAEEEFARVDRLLETSDHESIERAAAVFRAHLERARAAEATARGEPEVAAEHCRRAETASQRGRELIEKCDSPERHKDVRLALHIWRATAPVPVDTREQTVVCPEGTWFRIPGGERVDLHHRRPLRRILHALIEAWARSPGTAVPIDYLVRYAWPGQELAEKTGASRIYVAVGELRTLGLRRVLVRHANGYMLDHQAPIVAGQKPQ